MIDELGLAKSELVTSLLSLSSRLPVVGDTCGNHACRASTVSAPSSENLQAAVRDGRYLRKVLVAWHGFPFCWWIVSVPSSSVWLTAADAAWANRPDGSSTSGHVIMAAHPNILRCESSTVSAVAWNSRKIRRVVRSSLGAECAAFSTGLEHTDMLYGEICGDLCDLAEKRNISSNDRCPVRERLQEPGQMLSSLPVPQPARRLRINALELSSA